MVACGFVGFDWAVWSGVVVAVGLGKWGVEGCIGVGRVLRALRVLR